jgi:hypothetical protein
MAETLALPGRLGREAPRWRRWAGVAAGLGVSVRQKVRDTTRPARAHLAGHAYTIAGFGCFSAASFYHSVFTGLLVSGALFLVYEWKVSE